MLQTFDQKDGARAIEGLNVVVFVRFMHHVEISEKKRGRKKKPIHKLVQGIPSEQPKGKRKNLTKNMRWAKAVQLSSRQ